MKKMLICFLMIFGVIISLFSQSFKTGEVLPFYPVSTPRAANKNGDGTSSYITKISKAIGYDQDTYEFCITSEDWVASTILPVVFTYIVKVGDELEFVQTKNIYLGSSKNSYKIKSISTNSIEFEEIINSTNSITPSEDSL